MKLTKIVCALIGVLGVNTAFAAISCVLEASPNPIVGTGTFHPSNNTSCGKNTTMGITGNIGGASGVGGWQQGTTAGISIFALQLGATNSATLSIAAGTAFIPEVEVTGPGATCTDGAPAYVTDSTATAIGGQLATPPAVGGVLSLPANATAGTYYIFVGDVTGLPNDAGCGDFALTVGGTLPVKLEKFSVD